MSQSSVDLITELHTQWMQTSRALTRSFEEARVLLQESRALLQDIEERMDEAWRVFHEELKAMEDQRDASLPKEEEGEEELVEDHRYPDYEEPVPHPALEHVFEHMYDHMPYEDEEPVPYEEPVPHPALEHVFAHMYDHMPYGDEERGYDSEDDSEEVDNEVELLNDDELLDIVW